MMSQVNSCPVQVVTKSACLIVLVLSRMQDLYLAIAVAAIEVSGAEKTEGSHQIG